ncbi:aldose 1-epimerase family protein [Frankia sp. AgKG'84/4]|uniref:aldose 1-epimerase family protein n=1 Tax=Frankia sp. AgKG'84/4 TaxID=573490 RepID=UPI00200D025E|nr:aldose 1-epimerase family protein [Frankia sp. AgKG'84/4]MCL9794360.1 aldose 1-epimerase family protein [Frankia sp. AgKG'84/4]
MTALAPSGRQAKLVHDDSSVIITEVGGGLREYRVGERAVLDGYDADAMASRGRGQLLLPWPNRIADGRYTFDGASQQLPINEVALRNANHGLTRWSAWEIEQSAPGELRASFVLRAQSGYPFTVGFTAEYRLDAAGLAVTITATNLGDRPAPVGLGVHPYLVVAGPGGAPVRADDAELTVPAATRLVTDERLIPTGTRAVAGGEFDFRAPRPIGPLVLDTCYTDLVADPDGRTRVRLAAPGGSSVTVWMDDAWQYLQVFTGDTLGPDERRRSVAIEPLTCPANAFNSGDGLRVLAPAESFAGSWGIQPAGPA